MGQNVAEVMRDFLTPNPDSCGDMCEITAFVLWFGGHPDALLRFSYEVWVWSNQARNLTMDAFNWNKAPDC